MAKTMSFGEAVEAADHLSGEEQQSLVELLRKRMIERRRMELAADVRAAKKEFKQGACRPVTPSGICKEIRS